VPEVPDRFCQVGQVEVLHQPESQDMGAAYCYVGVSAEVAVNLEGEEEGCEEQSASAEQFG